MKSSGEKTHETVTNKSFSKDMIQSVISDCITALIKTSSCLLWRKFRALATPVPHTKIQRKRQNWVHIRWFGRRGINHEILQEKSGSESVLQVVHLWSQTSIGFAQNPSISAGNALKLSKIDRMRDTTPNALESWWDNIRNDSKHEFGVRIGDWWFVSAPTLPKHLPGHPRASRKL